MNTSDSGACQNDLPLICNVISSPVSAAREDERWIMSCNSLFIKWSQEFLFFLPRDLM